MAVRAITQLGVPRGGGAGQSLTKKSDADFDYEWDTPAAGTGTVTDAQMSTAISTALVPYVSTTSLTNTLSEYPTNTTLAGVQTQTATDIAAAKNRANHTGAQAISTVTGLQTALNGKADLVSGKVPSSQLPAITITDTVTVASQAAMLALTTTQVQRGDVAVRTDGAGSFILTADDPSVLGNWTPLNTAGSGVMMVNNQTGNVTLGKADIGLGSVDNTSDLGKPVSTATQTALNLKANSASPTFTGTVSGVTKAHVGLGNVDNTSDANKPVSTATQTALNTKVSTVSGTINGLWSGTQAQYNAIVTKSSGTLYVIAG